MNEKIFQEQCTVENIEKLGAFFEITFSSKSIAKLAKPGQFIEVKTNDSFYPFFRRPFTVFRNQSNYISILFRVVGIGTYQMSNFRIGQKVDLIGPLGNSVFDFNLFDNDTLTLLAGGVGIANMIPIGILSKHLGKKSKLYWGIKSKEEMFEKYLEYFDYVKISSNDGTIGEKGFITDIFAKEYNEKEFVYSCGPIQMIKTLNKFNHIDKNKIIVSLETVMGCGMGICYGCVVKSSKNENLLVCKDGPNFYLSHIDVENI